MLRLNKVEIIVIIPITWLFSNYIFKTVFSFKDEKPGVMVFFNTTKLSLDFFFFFTRDTKNV